MSNEAEQQNKEEVAEMLDELESPDLGGNEEEEEEEIIDTEIEEEEEEDPELEEEEEELDPELEEEEEEEFDDLDDLDDEDDLKNEVAELRKTVADLIKQRSGESASDDEDEIKLEDVDVDFVSEEEFEQIYQDRDVLNAVLKRVFNQGREFSLREGANIVSKKIIRDQSVRQSAREFYQQNPDLLKHKEYVAVVANQIAAKYPGKNISFWYDKTAQVVRKRLNITKKASDLEEQRKKKRKSKTAFAKKPGSSATKRKSKSSDDPKSFEEEQKAQIDNLLDDLD